jgi:GntR family transcriptional regulator/MocR family aminotransferase
MHIASLYRYPVKGLSPEPLDRVQVVAGQGFPLDRKYALLRTEVPFDPAAPAWLPKANFVMLMLHEPLAALRTRYSPQGSELRVRTAEGRELSFAMDTDAGRRALGEFFLGYLPKRLAAPPKVLEAKGHQFTDKAEKLVSLINLASVRQLEKMWGVDLDPLRFRANVYIDGAEPFRELDWVGREIRLGSAFAQVVQRNGRCAATNVNPQTGVRDRDIPGKLRGEFGHKDLGVYLRILEAGLLQPGDEVEVEPAVQEKTCGVKDGSRAGASLICSACYYLLDAAATSAQHLPTGYRCPDCGAGRDAVVPSASFNP